MCTFGVIFFLKTGMEQARNRLINRVSFRLLCAQCLAPRSNFTTCHLPLNKRKKQLQMLEKIISLPHRRTRCIPSAPKVIAQIFRGQDAGVLRSRFNRTMSNPVLSVLQMSSTPLIFTARGVGGSETPAIISPPPVFACGSLSPALPPVSQSYPRLFH